MHNSLWNKGRTSIQGQALYVRSAGQTAWAIEVRAVLRHSVPNKGLHPLRRCAAIPAHFAAGTICFQQTVPAAKSENPILSVRSSTENVGGLFLSYPSQQKGGHSL